MFITMSVSLAVLSGWCFTVSLIALLWCAASSRLMIALLLFPFTMLTSFIAPYIFKPDAFLPLWAVIVWSMAAFAKYAELQQSHAPHSRASVWRIRNRFRKASHSILMPKPTTRYQDWIYPRSLSFVHSMWTMPMSRKGSTRKMSNTKSGE